MVNARVSPTVNVAGSAVRLSECGTHRFYLSRHDGEVTVVSSTYEISSRLVLRRFPHELLLQLGSRRLDYGRLDRVSGSFLIICTSAHALFLLRVDPRPLVRKSTR